MRARAGLALLAAAVLWLGSGLRRLEARSVPDRHPRRLLRTVQRDLPGERRVGRAAAAGAWRRDSSASSPRAASRVPRSRGGRPSSRSVALPETKTLSPKHGGWSKRTAPRRSSARSTHSKGSTLREYARTRPETAFVIQPSGAPELTLTDPAPNVFRFASDAAQFVAGLGAYAYDVLGWRKAAIVADDNPVLVGWRGGLHRRVLRSRRSDRRP